MSTPAGSGRHLVLPDGHEGAAHARVFEIDGAQSEKNEGYGCDVVKIARGLQFKGADPRRGNRGDAVGTIGQPDRIDQDELEDDPEPDRRHRQVVAG